MALLDELKGCYAGLGKRNGSKTEEQDTGCEILMEILLSFASKPSKLFARMSMQVFESVSDRMTAASLQHLLNVSIFFVLS